MVLIHRNFCGPFPSGKYFLVFLMDEHSRFPEIEIIRSTSTTVTIKRFEKIISFYGFPVEFVTDMAHLSTDTHFTTIYSGKNEEKHRKITSYWPQANANVERLMRTLQKSVGNAYMQDKNWRTKVAPDDIPVLFNHQLHNRLPCR